MLILVPTPLGNPMAWVSVMVYFLFSRFLI